MPPLGHWAKVAAGKKPPVAKLRTDHRGPTRYVRRQRIDSEEQERQTRIEGLLESNPQPSVETLVMKATVDDCLPAVRRTGKHLKPLDYNGRGLLHSHGPDVFPMSVSVGNKIRALLILDAILETALKAGGKLESWEKKGQSSLVLRLRGERFSFCVRESSQRTERDLTREEVKEKKAGKLFYIRDRYAFTPTGKLRLEIREEDSYYPLLSATDGATPLETRLGDVVQNLIEKAAEICVRREMRDEERRRWQAAQERRRALEALRDKELEHLKTIEVWVAQWKRAADLRAFAAAVESAAETGEAFTVEPAWIRNAADWLDPLVSRHWPTVDIDEPSDPLYGEEESQDSAS